MQRVLSNVATEYPTVTASAEGPSSRATVLTLLAGDLLAILIGTGVGFVAATAMGHGAWFGAWHVLVPALAVPLFFGLADLYPGAGVSPVDELRSATLILTVLAASGSLVTLTLNGFVAASLVPLGITYLVTLIAIIEIRILQREILGSKAWWGAPTVVLGGGSTARRIIESLEHRPHLNLKVVACLDDDESKWGDHVAGIPITGPIQEKALQLRRIGANYVIVAMPSLEPHALSKMVHSLSRVFSNVVVTPNTFGMTSVGVGTRDSGAVVGLHVRGHLSLRRNLLIKRATDLALLVPLGLLALPILAIAVLLTIIFSPGNPFYAQEREGYGGRKLKLWKLRSMRRDADALLAEYLAENPAARAEWQTRFKLSKDPRIIPVVGSLFRRMSIDELPQLWNIAKGELSFVGPRPFPDYHLESFDAAFRDLRSSVAPGLTGYWQVTSRASTDLAGQVELDTYYITNWSLWLDLYVLARTPWAVIFGKGAL